MKSIKGLVSKYPYGYYIKAKGVHVWETLEKKLIDMGIMGVGSCILGYADDDVNNAVKRCIDNGSMSTHNCYEDEQLAELLIQLHPWADKVRYARTGGEAMAIALKLAQERISYHKDALIRFRHCGYHGWHFGYPNDENDFEFNDCNGLGRAAKFDKIIILEILRHEEPTKEFIETIKEVQKGRVLIIDEITSGFRICNGGAHLHYGLEPDIAVFGKAIGNGFPITAVIGKEEVMNTNAFISSTFWTERIGPTAAIATIEKILKEKVVEKLNKLGGKIRMKLLQLGIQTKLPNSLIQLELENVDEFQKRMYERGYIARDQIYLSYCHTKEIFEGYLKNVKEVLEL